MSVAAPKRKSSAGGPKNPKSSPAAKKAVPEAVKENSDVNTGSAPSTPKKNNSSGETTPTTPPTKHYPQVDLARTRILHGKADEALARDVMRGGGVLVKGERIEFWFNPSIEKSKQGIEETQLSLPVAAAVADSAAPQVDTTGSSSAYPSTQSTPLVQSAPIAAKKKEAGSPKKPASAKPAAKSKVDLGPTRWIRGTVASSNMSRYTVTVELDSPLPVAPGTAAGSKKPNSPIKVVVVYVKSARWKLVEFLESTYEGRVYQPRSDVKPSAPSEYVSEKFRCELVYSDEHCKQVDLVETKKEFLRSRKVGELKKVYQFKYVVPANEQQEMEELRKNERDILTNLNKEVKTRTDEINAKVERELTELETRRSVEIIPLELQYETKKKEIDLERDEKTARLEALEGRATGTGQSLRVQKKMIDDNHKARWTKEVIPLEKKLGLIDTQLDSERRALSGAGRDEITAIVQKRDDYAAAVKARAQALRDKWKKLAQDDVNNMRLSQTIRCEKEFLLIRKIMAETLDKTKQPVGILKGIDSTCNVCRLNGAFQCQQGKCDSCYTFSIYEDKINELELRVPWANNRTSSDFTPYHVFYHERSRQIRAEKPNTEPALISQQVKEEWKRLPEKEKNRYEIRRQESLLELMDHIEEEEEEIQMSQRPLIVAKKEELEDLKQQDLGRTRSGAQKRIREPDLSSEEDMEDESDEACTRCISLKNPSHILQCDRTEGEQITPDDDRICGGMLHTYCCHPPLAAVPDGDWFCSWLCDWVEHHKPVNAKSRPKPFKKILGHQHLKLKQHAERKVTDNIVIADEDAIDEDAPASHSHTGRGGRAADSVQVKADVVVAKRNRFEFILSQWSVIGYFMGENAEKIKANIENRLAVLDHQLEGISADAIQLKDKILSAGVPFPFDTTPPYVEQAEMRPYQLDGLSWFIEQHDKGANSIMGDEMGLGKTLQTLSFFATIHHFLPFFSLFLVVCPLSVLPNWIAEAKRWTPQLNVVGLFGPLAERDRIKANFSGSHKNEVHVIVTTYEILLTEITWLRSKFYFRYFVLDEAQKIKNTDALVTQACRQIRSVYRVLLTGTPLQNNMRELWSLLNFLYPEIFTAATVGRFATAYDSSTTSDDTSSVMIKDDSFMRQCHRLLEPIMLRRLKQNVLAALLPPKTEIVLTAPMSLAQQHHYKQVLKTVTGMVRNVGYKNVSSLLWQLWKCCLHPFLFEGVEEAATTATDDGHSVDSKIVWMSGKMSLLDGLLTKLFADKSKCLVYSQYTSMLDIIEEYCQWRGWKYLRLDGSTSLARRRFYMHLFNQPVYANATPEEFKRDHYFVFLVSTKAGGVGVNLQAANSVILYDSSWNPFVDAQAEDRAHRMGQKKEVTIYRLITKGTCEERIRFFAQQKLKMKQFVLNEDESGEKRVLQADIADEWTDVSKIYSGDQLRDILEYGSEELIKSGEGLPAGAEYNPVLGEQFYNACCDALDDQLRQAAEQKLASPKSVALATKGDRMQLSPEKRNICIRKFGEEDFSRTKVERTTEMDWLDIMEEEKIVQRNRKATTIIVDTHERGLGKIQVSRWSIEQEAREKEMMERDRARIEAKKIGGNKRVTEHDMNCLHCRESVLKQKVIVTTELDDHGNEVKKRRIDTDNSGYQACPMCPATMHLSCVRLAIHGLEPNTRASCPQHKCRICRRSASNAGGLLFKCVDCPTALCYDCVEKYELVDHFKFLERDKVRWETDLGYTAASTYEYMQCPDCFHKHDHE